MTPLIVVQPMPVTPAMLTGTSVPENDYPEWDAGATYAADARVILAAEHKVYESAVADNVGNNPLTSDKWLEVGATNRWRAFDASISTQTTMVGGGWYEITTPKAMTALALLHMTGVQAVRVRVVKAGDALPDAVYDRTLVTRRIPLAAGWWQWFFGERAPKTQVVLRDLPSYPGATIRIDIESSGTAGVGVILLGRSRSIGMSVLQGATHGIQDYSRKERNAWGDVMLQKRPFAKRASFEILLRNNTLDGTQAFLEQLRSTPCLYLGSERYESRTIFGFYTNFQLLGSLYEYSELSIDIEGLPWQ